MFIKYILFISLIFVVACGTNQPVFNNQNIAKSEPTVSATPTPTPTVTPTATTKSEKGHHHEHKAPRDGTLVVFGEEFAHIELVLDEIAGRLTAYVLDGEAENAIQIEQAEIVIEVEKPKKMTFILTAVENALTGEKKGATSEFTLLSNDLKGLKKFDATIKFIKIKGQEFTSEKFNFPKGNEH